MVPRTLTRIMVVKVLVNVLVRIVPIGTKSVPKVTVKILFEKTPLQKEDNSTVMNNKDSVVSTAESSGGSSNTLIVSYRAMWSCPNSWDGSSVKSDDTC